MGYFKQKEPRRFNHKYIYVDERKEKLDRIVESAKRDLGMLPPREGSYKERIKGTFAGDDSHLSRRQQNGTRFSSTFIVGALLVCVFILFYLVKSIWLL